MTLYESFKHIERIGLSPDELYYLICLSENKKPQNILNNIVKKKLLNKKYIEIIDKKESITQEAVNLLKFLTIDVKGPSATQVLDYIDSYREIFPKGHLPSGVPARQNRKNLEAAFRWFFKNYNYDWSTIIKAANYYVKIFERKDYKYMQNSQYFIRKVNPDKTINSTLATYCDIIQSGEQEMDEKRDGFSDKVV